MPGTWLDSAIGWVSPQMGLRRVRARTALSMFGNLARSYDGAKQGRRTDGWIAMSGDANAEIGPAMARLRDRARDLVRNNPYAACAVKRHAANAIGEGIVPRAIKTVDDIFARWAEQADADGRTDFYGLQTLVVRTLVESGEVLIRKRPTWGSYEPLPLQVQVMEPDFLDPGQDTARSTDGGWVRHGIRYDAQGKRTGYYLYRQHPGAVDLSARNRFESTLVPAEEVLHVYDPLRAGQGRGVTWFAPALIRLRDLDDYDEAELVRKKIEACLAAFVTTDDEQRTLGAASVEDGDAPQRRLEDFNPGMVEYLRPGESVTLSQPGFAPGDAYSKYMSQQLHAIASALDLTYEIMTGDLSQVNFSSARMGLLQFRYRIRQVQTQILLPQLLMPVWRWFTEIGSVSGILRKQADGRIPVQWTYPRFESVQPLDDAKEEELRLRTGTLTWPGAVAARGFDPNDQFAEIVAWNKKFDAADLVLDGDPRKVAKSGSAQAKEKPQQQADHVANEEDDGEQPKAADDDEDRAHLLRLSLADARNRRRSLNGRVNGHA